MFGWKRLCKDSNAVNWDALSEEMKCAESCRIIKRYGVTNYLAGVAIGVGGALVTALGANAIRVIKTKKKHKELKEADK